MTLDWAHNSSRRSRGKQATTGVSCACHRRVVREWTHHEETSTFLFLILAIMCVIYDFVEYTNFQDEPILNYAFLGESRLRHYKNNPAGGSCVRFGEALLATLVP